MRGFGWQFNFDYKVSMLVVLWALAWAMIFLSALVYLPTKLVASVGIVMMAAHNLLDSVRFSSPLFSILHSPGFVVNNSRHVIFVAYPLIPWIGVTAAGYGINQIYDWPPDPAARHFFCALGSSSRRPLLCSAVSINTGDPITLGVRRNRRSLLRSHF